MTKRLQKLNDQHLDIIRRLIVGQTQTEIAQDLGTSQPRIAVLLGDPLFKARLNAERQKTMDNFHETRVTAMEILQEAAPDAAQLVVDAFKKGTVNGKELGVGKQLESAFDVLDRTGNKAIEKSLVGSIDLGKLIADAYKEKRSDGGNGKGDKPQEPQAAKDSAFDLISSEDLDITFEDAEEDEDQPCLALMIV